MIPLLEQVETSPSHLGGKAKSKSNRWRGPSRGLPRATGARRPGDPVRVATAPHPGRLTIRMYRASLWNDSCPKPRLFPEKTTKRLGFQSFIRIPENLDNGYRIRQCPNLENSKTRKFARLLEYWVSDREYPSFGSILSHGVLPPAPWGIPPLGGGKRGGTEAFSIRFRDELPGPLIAHSSVAVLW